jgi:hypothetical protein
MEDAVVKHAIREHSEPVEHGDDSEYEHEF